MAEASAAPDWEAIEREYRLGQLSLREIARMYGVSDTAIRKKAKVLGWTRDLSGKVREKVRTDLVRTEVRTPNAREPEIVEAAAARGVEVVRAHRQDIARLRGLSETLANRLERYLLLGAMPEPKTEKEREEMEKAQAELGAFIGIRETPGDLLDKLSKTLHRLVPLERQAFSLDDPTQGPDGPKLSRDQVERAAREVLGGE